MTPERWQEVERLYHAALEKAAAQREAFLDQACGGDADLRREVGSLLSEDAEAEHFIESSAMQIAAREVARDSHRLTAGQRLGSYEILAMAGEGGMGEVYRARDLRLGRIVAIKTLRGAANHDRDQIDRFLNEARLAAVLNHPNVAHIYEVGEVGELGETKFIAMELVEGHTLASAIARKTFDEQTTIEIALQIADALDAAHAKGIIHRDIKPANVMLTERGQVKVLDFGIAKLFAIVPGEENAVPPAGKTATGLVVGTLDYMSPEQVLGRALDARTDLFSLGVVLYEMTAGHPPFRGASQPATLDSLLHQDPPPVSEIIATISPEFERTVRKCLEKDPAHRYQSAQELLADLRSLQRAHISRSVATLVATQESIAVRRSGWSRAAMWIAAVLGLAVAAVLAWRIWGSHAPAGTNLAGARLTLLVSSETRLDEPDLSPDGKMIVYTGEENGQTDLFLARISGGARVRLTNDKAVEGRPGFSPDGERIVFTRLGEGSIGSDLVLIPSLGGDAAPVVHNAFDGAFSPDGRSLAYVRAGPDQALAVAASDGSHERIVLPPDAAYPFLRNPAWSPDGSQIAVERSAGGAAGETWLVSRNGDNRRRLTHDAAGVFSHAPRFTADGGSILDSSNRDGATNLWRIGLDGSRPVRLTSGPGPDSSPVVARNGAIVFTNSRSRHSLLIHDFKTHNNRTLVTHPFYLWSPAFSRDGQTLAFSRFEASGLWHIWTVAVEGGTPRQLTTGGSPEIYPRFTEDGVVYHTSTLGRERVWRVPSTGGAAVALTPPGDSDDSYADVSPDGKTLAFGRTEGGSTHIWIAPVKGGPARRLVDADSTLPRWSPDGQYICFSPSRDHQAGIFVVAADGSGLRRISPTGSWPVWWPDGKRIGFIASGPDGNQQIFTVPASGGTATAFTGVQFQGNNFPFDISPDGSLLATSNSMLLTAEIWMLEFAR